MHRETKWFNEPAVRIASESDWHRNPVLKLHRRLRLVFSAILCCILAGGGVLFYHLKTTKHERLLENAQSALKAGNYELSATGITAVLNADPGNARALGLMVTLLEKGGADEEALHWYERLVAAEPGNVVHTNRAATLALDLGEVSTAEKFLANREGMAASAEGVEFYRAAARLALARGNHHKAAAIFAHVLQVATNGGTSADRLNAAITRMLTSGDGDAKRTTALREIEKLVSDPKVGTQALRTLIEVNLHRSDSRDGQLSRLLSSFQSWSETSNQFGPKLETLDYTYRAKDSRWKAMLSNLQTGITSGSQIDRDALYWLIQWMNDRELSSEAIAWTDRLYLPERDGYPLGLGLAEAYINCGQWKAVCDLLETADWGELRFLKLTMLAKALNQSAGQQSPERRDMSWKLAMEFAGKKAAKLQLLEVFLRKHEWTDMHLEVLWKLADHVGPVEVRASACARLKQHYLAAGDLNNCSKVAALAVKAMPHDYIEESNWIYTSLLLDSGNSAALVQQAQQLFESHPDISPVISNYAFARFCSGDYAQAADLLKRLPEPFRKHPAVAPICGIILARAGANDEAREYLELPHRVYFEAEHKLVAAARESLQTSTKSVAGMAR
ncbi:MAG: tetratricopeptide (TPR) repeat protein [Verrucomicrobiales bacterium]